MMEQYSKALPFKNLE